MSRSIACTVFWEAWLMRNLFGNHAFRFDRAAQRLHGRGILAVLVLSAGVTVEPARAQWAELDQVLASDPATADNFGRSVAMSGNAAVIGAPQADPNGNDSGAAYVLLHSGGAWTEQQILLPADGSTFAYFGHAVAIDGDAILVGAWGESSNGVYAGAAYVFRRSGNTWNQESKLLPADGAQYDFFGQAVSLSGTVAVIGAWGEDTGGVNAGAAYVFRNNGSSWTQEQKLTAATAGSKLGSSVAAAPGWIFAGAPGHNQSGAAMVFSDNGATWSHTQTLHAADADLSDQFAASLAAAGDTLVVGAPMNDDFGSNSGSAYVFRLMGSSWEEEQKLLADDGQTGDLFGDAVAAIPGITVIGASGDAPDAQGFLPQAGSAYVFCFDSGETNPWAAQAKLVEGYPSMWNHFGAAIAISGDAVLAGSYGDDVPWGDAGSATVFTGQCAGQSGCTADLTGDGQVGTDDLALLVGAWGDNPGHPADLNGNGIVNAADLAFLQGAWGPCP